MKLESANVAARNKVDTNSDGTTSAGMTTTCASKDMERGHLTNMTAMTPENDAKCKRDQTYRIELKKNFIRSLLYLIRELCKKRMIKKKGIRALPKLIACTILLQEGAPTMIACTILLQEGAPTMLSKDSPKQQKNHVKVSFFVQGHT